MTAMLAANALAVIAVGIVGLLRGRDRRVDGLGTARGLMIAGLILLALQAAIFALFGVGEMASGDVSGAGHFIPLVGTVLLAFLAWKRPIEAGVGLVVVGIVAATQFCETIANLIMAGPPLVSGVLFLAGGIAGRSASLSKRP